MDNMQKKGTTIAGLAIFGCLVTGAVSLVLTVMMALAGMFMEAGVLLIAAALAFGLLTIGVFER